MAGRPRSDGSLVWYLQAFEKNGHRMIKSYPLNSVGIGQIRSLWPGQSDAELVGLSWPVEPSQATVLGLLAHEQLRLDQYNYFVNFYTEDQRDSAAGGSRRTGTHEMSDPASTVQFMNEIAVALPGAARVIHARRQEERGEILPHMEMSDLIWWAGETYAASQNSDELGRRARREIREFLRMLEDRFEVGDQDLDDLIATSFLEGLATQRESLSGLRALLGPRMLAWYRIACEGDDSEPSS